MVFGQLEGKHCNLMLYWPPPSSFFSPPLIGSLSSSIRSPIKASSRSICALYQPKTGLSLNHYIPTSRWQCSAINSHGFGSISIHGHYRSPDNGYWVEIIVAFAPTLISETMHRTVLMGFRLNNQSTRHNEQRTRAGAWMDGYKMNACGSSTVLTSVS